jgi:antitoxin component of MazEF toxin-antitoxin module
MSEITEIRRVQAYAGDKSLTIVLPRSFAYDLQIGKGDFLKVRKEGNTIILEKADF